MRFRLPRPIQAALIAAILALGVPAARALTETEPNDSINDPGVQFFSAGQTLQGDFDDLITSLDDYWAINASVGQSYHFQASVINCSGLDSPDLGLEIVDQFGGFIAASDFTGACGQEGLNFTPSFSGTFYLIVYEATGTPTTGFADYQVVTSSLTTPTPSRTPPPPPSPTFTPSPTASPTPSPTPPQNQGTGRDVPTWEIGHAWDYTRTFSLDLDLSQVISAALGSPIQADATLDVTDTYRLTVTAIEDHLTTISGSPIPQRVYVRTRSNAAVAGTGILNLGGTPFATLDLPTTGSLTDTGVVWTRVSDLGDAHENFRFTAMLDATFPTTGTPRIDLARFDVSINFDHDPPLESADFPLDVLGEQWINGPTRRAHGWLYADFPTIGSSAPGTLLIPGFGPLPAPADAVVPIDKSQTLNASGFYAGPDAARQGYSPTYHTTNAISGPNGENHWYAPSAEEFVERQFPPIQLTDSGSTITAVVRNLRTLVVPGSAVVTPETISGLHFVPYRPAPSSSFSLYGVVNPAPPAGTTVNAKILDTGATGSGTTNGSGGFSINLTAPSTDDFSPASEDGGSFGVELTLVGFPDRKVVSVQLSGAGISPVSSWADYE